MCSTGRGQRPSSECVAFVKTRHLPSPSRRSSSKDAAAMSSCDDNKNNTTMNRGACALIVTSASPSSTRTSSASTLSGSGSRGGGSGSAEGSGFRGSGGRRITVFTVAPQVLVTAASTASTATASLLAALQKKRAKKDSAPFDQVVMSAENHVATDVISGMQSQQQHRPTQVEGKLKISCHIYSTFEIMKPVICTFQLVKLVLFFAIPDFALLLVASFGTGFITLNLKVSQCFISFTA